MSQSLPIDISNVLSYIPTAVVVWDVINKRVAASNRSIYKELGYHQSENYSFENWKDLLHPQDKATYDELELKKLNTQSENRCFTCEVRLKKADNTWQWYSISVGVFEISDAGIILKTIVSFSALKIVSDFEKVLLESNERYSTLADASSGGIGIHDKGLIIEANQELAKMSGYAQSELIGMDGLLLIAPQERDRVMEKILSDYQEPYESIGYRKDGSTYPLEINGKVIQYKGKNVRVTEFRNIEQRKHFENLFQQSETKYHDIIEFAVDGFLIGDKNGLVVKANKRILEITGKTTEEVEGKHISNFFTKQVLESNPLRFDLLQEGKTVVNLREILKPDGSIVYIEMHSKKMPDGTYQAIVRDVTSRKKIENSIKHSENLYRSIIENIADVYCRFNNKEELVLGSPSGAKLFGFSSVDDMIGLHLNDLWVYQHEKLEFLKLIKENRKVENFKVTLKRKDNKLIDVALSASYYRDESGNIKGVEGIIRDVTEQERYKISLKNREERARKQRITIVELATDELLFKPDLTQGFHKVTQLSAHALDVARASIWQLSENGKALYCKSIFDGVKNAHIQCVDLELDNYPKYFNTILSQNRISVADTLTDPRTAELVDGYLLPMGITSMLDAGIVVGGKLVGIICFEHVGEPRSWEIDEESFVSNLGSIIAQSIIGAERLNAESALRQSEERLRYVIDATNDGVWDLDLITNKAFYSDRYYTMLGYNPGEFEATHQAWRNLLHHHDIGYTEIILKKYLQEKLPEFNIEYRLKAKDGTWRWIFSRGKIVQRDNSGKPIRIIGTHVDITDKKNAEEQLKESRNLLISILDTIPVRVFWKDKDLKYLGCNKAFATDAGYSKPEKIIGCTDFDMVWSKDADFFRSDDLAIMKSGLPNINYDEQLTTADGVTRWLKSSKIPLRDSNGKVVGILGTYDDISEMKEVSETIELERTYFEQLFEGAPEGIALLDVDDNVIRSNEEFTRMFGYEHQEVEGEPINKLIVPEDLKEEGLKLTNTVAAGDMVKHETLRMRKDGTLINVSILGKPIYFQGGKIAVYGIYRDISHRKKVEEELIHKNQEIEAQNEEYRIINEELYVAKQKAEESDKLKSAFLANMSHEIRTPMNGILGFSQLLTNPDIPEVDVDKYVEVIQSSGNQLLDIINDLIDISKIEANQVTIINSEVNINKVLQEQHMLFSQKAEKLGVEFSIGFGLPNEHCSIITDGGRLKQILTNLIGNALKFVKEGYVRIGYQVYGSELQFFVEDSGIGILPEHQEIIFDRFRQVETSLSQQVGGTGLGLAISKAFVDKLGGKIWVDSTPHVGSTFFFTLPYKPSESVVEVQQKRVQDYVSDIGSGITILVAEDDDINFFYIREMLSGFDFDIIRAKNGVECVQIVKDNPSVNIILMDIKMPDMDGYQATREVKKIRANIPVIAQTAYAFSSDQEKALEAGCDDYISKPIDRVKLVSMLNKFLSNKR